MSKIEDCVAAKLQARAAIGLAKYGVTMERMDLSRRDWLIHAQEEAMDLAVYLERLIKDDASVIAGSHVRIIRSVGDVMAGTTGVVQRVSRETSENGEILFVIQDDRCGRTFWMDRGNLEPA